VALTITTAETEEPRLGHNNPPPDQIIDLDDATKAAQEKAAEHAARVAELLAGFERWKALGPIADDVRQGRSGDFAVLLGKDIKLIEADRTAVKEPVLALSRAVDAAFKAHTDPLLAAKQDIESAQTVYAKAKAAEALKAAQAERERLQREAAAQRQRDIEAAELAAAEAELNGEEAPAIVVAPVAQIALPTVAEVTRTNGDYSLSSLKGTWKVRVVNAAEIPAAYMTPNLVLVEAAMKSSRVKSGPPTAVIPGVEFYLEEKIGNR
jgi:hypothetical protein